MITFEIDLTQIDQSKCKKIMRKNGQRASFAKFVLIETPDGQYGDYAVKQDTTKEERQSGVKMPFIGNGKNVGSEKPATKPAAPAQKSKPQADPALDAPEDDIPF